jgi:UDP-glucose 4-epimerase
VISLASACQQANVLKIIFSSTAAVYGEAKVTGLISEKTETSPINPYGTSKLMCERVLQDCELGFGLKSICLRYFNVAGAGVDGNNGQRTKNATHLISVAAKTALKKRSQMEVFGTDFSTPDGSGVRDYIHVQDLANLHVLALKYLEKNGESEIFNCGYGLGFSVLQVIEAMQRVSKYDFPVQLSGRRAGDPACLVADCSKVKKIFNWQPQYDNIELICRTAFEWEKKQN